MIIPTPRQRLSCMARFTFLDEENKPIPAIDQHGNEVWGADWQPNMITDAGLDLLTEATAMATAGNQASLRRYLALDTASSEIKDKSGPITAAQSGNVITASAAFFVAADVGRAIVFADGANARITGFTSDTEITVDKSQAVPAQTFERWHVERTSLSNAMFESNDDGGFGNPPGTVQFTASDLVVRTPVTRVCTLTSSQNLTGYGFTPTSGGTIAVMELFRDAQGNPITLSLTAGKKVRVDHELAACVHTALGCRVLRV